MELIYLIGVPGVGKSYILKQYMAKLGPWSSQRINGKLHTYKSGKVRVLGVYQPNETFPGTDRLAMDVVTAAEAYFKTMPDELVIAEGDRLNNKRFFRLFDKKTVLYIKADPGIIEQRRVQRGSKQNLSFLKRIATKCDNMQLEYPDCVRIMPNETTAQTGEILRFMFQKSVNYADN